MSKVLVVDDSPVDRRVAGGLLEKHPEIEVLYASNGAEALRQIDASLPDIVVTDLQMPEMDGLKLVGMIRSAYPLVPVILMTGQGSEEIAVEALEEGAASYVSKAQLARDLLDTVENVLAVARADRRHEQLIGCRTSIQERFEIASDPALIPPLVDQLQRHVSEMRLCDETGRIRVGIALEEALLNALYHGNLELSTDALREASATLFNPQSVSLIESRRHEHPYAGRKIYVEARVTPYEAVYVVRDDGPGFDPASVPDPTDPANLERETGRGLVLMRTFMNDVQYSANGTEVTLIKRRDQ